MKGVGEAGTIGATPAIANAVIDALAPLGVKHLDMPFTPEKVWRAIRDAASTPSVTVTGPPAPAREPTRSKPVARKKARR